MVPERPRGIGTKRASIRIYAVTELIRLVERAGLALQAVHRGCFPDAFAGGDQRLGLLTRRSV